MTMVRTNAILQRAIVRLAFAAVAILMLTLAASAAATPYARVPSAGDSVRFDGSAAGYKHAWAYPNQNSLEAFLRMAIDAALSSAPYDEHNAKMSAVFARSLTLDNGAQAQVQKVQHFSYRGHDDIEVLVRVESGSLSHALVWTTPAELVDSHGHRYLAGPFS